MVDIFDEIAEDMRSERAMALLRRYGGLFAALAVLVLLGVGAQQIWQSREASRNDAAAAKYLALTQQIDARSDAPAPQRLADAKALTSFAASAPAGYRTLARLRAAGLYAAGGQASAAAALWTDIAGDAGADPLLRQLADLLWAQHALGSAPDDEVLGRLSGLTDPANPWHGLAEETEALVYLHDGKTDQAKTLLARVAEDPSAPDGARNRADGLLAQLNG